MSEYIRIVQVINFSSLLFNVLTNGCFFFNFIRAKLLLESTMTRFLITVRI